MRAMPKSSTLARDSAPSSTFDGLRSRWMMPCACAAASASASCQAISTVSATGNGPRSRRVDERFAFDMFEHHDHLAADVEHVVHRGDVRMTERGDGARLPQQAAATFSGGGGVAVLTVFRATLRCRRVSSASQTTPIPPAPSWRMIRYGPTDSPSCTALYCPARYACDAAASFKRHHLVGIDANHDVGNVIVDAGEPVAGAGGDDDGVAGLQLVRHAVSDRGGIAAGAVQQADVLVGGGTPRGVDQIRTGDERRGSGNHVIDLADEVVLGHGSRLRLIEPGAMHHADRHAALADVDRAHLLVDLACARWRASGTPAVRRSRCRWPGNPGRSRSAHSAHRPPPWSIMTAHAIKTGLSIWEILSPSQSTRCQSVSSLWPTPADCA